jgi:hypothetical protein
MKVRENRNLEQIIRFGVQPSDCWQYCKYCSCHDLIPCFQGIDNENLREETGRVSGSEIMNSLKVNKTWPILARI